MIARPLILSLTLLLAGCDLDALMADPKAVQKEADSRAIGGACRHGLRSIEDCFAMNDKASKAAIFTGWREMDQYMRDIKIDGVEPKGLKPPAVAAAPVVAPDEEVVDAPKPEKKPAAKSKAKAADKG